MFFVSCFVASLSMFGQTADHSGEIQVGATKAEVIKVLGWPNGQSKAGSKEIFSYAQGQVTLEDGRVTRVNFSANVPRQSPKPEPASAAATSSRSLQAVQAWCTDFAQASAEAGRLSRPILVLFIGPKLPLGAPRIFEDVASHPEFVDAFRNEFVLLRVEFGTELGLRERCEITRFPTVVFLNPAGAILGRVDTLPTPSATLRGRVIAAIRDAWLAVGGDGAPGPSSNTSVGATQGPPPPAGAARWIDDARGLIITGVKAGIVIMLLLLWLLWRNWSVAQPKRTEMTRRISEAASGLPTLDETRKWSQKTVCAVAAIMAESEGYHVDTYKLGDNADLELRRPGDTRPHALLLAVGAADGMLNVNRLRDLEKEMISSQVQGGWVVAPAGFGSDAVSFGRKHNLTLVNGEVMLARLRDVPLLSLSAALAQTGASRTGRQR